MEDGKKKFKKKKKDATVQKHQETTHYYPTPQVQFLVSKTLQSDKPFIDPIRMKTDTTQKL